MEAVPPLAELLLRFDAEATFGTLDTPRAVVRYCEWGQGPVIVFIHGLTDRMASFAPIMYRLKDQFRCIAYNLANGRDDGANIRQYRHQDYVEDLYYLLNALSIDELSVFGSSFGSTIALSAMADEPGRFRQGILQGGFARRPLNRWELLLARGAQFFPGRMSQLPGRMKVVTQFDRPQMAGAEAGMWEFLLGNMNDTPNRTAALRALMLTRLDLRPKLPGIHQPVLMLGGDRDLTVPRHCEMEVVQGLPNAQRVQLHLCGHYAQYTHPDECARHVREFLLNPRASA
jgi:pimeloyl-ACP methyl ester carboxylesterase